MDSSQFCHWPWSKIKIAADGTVRNCCYHFHFMDITEIGQWTTHPLLNAMRQSIADGTIHEHCFKGGCCPYRSEQHRHRVYKLSEWAYPDRPIIMELDVPNTKCNIGGSHPSAAHPACLMCPRNLPDLQPDDQRFLEVLEIAKSYIPTLQQLWLIGLGETFWQNYYLDVLDKLDFFDYRWQVHYTTYSNGTCFNRSTQDTFLRNIPHSLVTVSLDAASQETYTRLRRLPMFDQVVANIKEFVRNPMRNPATQRIGVTYNINAINVHEVEKMVQMWEGIDLESVCFTLTTPTGSKELEPYLINEENKEIFAAAELKIHETAQKCRVNCWMSSHLEPIGQW